MHKIITRTILAGLALTTVALPAAAVDLKALANDPCLLLPKTMIAELLKAPEAEIHQQGMDLGTVQLCSAEWSGVGHEVSAKAQVEFLTDNKLAARRFETRTKSENHEVVQGIAKGASFDSNEGRLLILQGAAIISLQAYGGESMPMPDEITASSFVEAAEAWNKETMTIRKQQTVQLAEALFNKKGK